VQRIMDSKPYIELFPESRLFGKNIRTVTGHALRNSDIFEIVGHRGSYRGAGVGGGITGMGGDYIIIDDPIKNREEANSSTYREKLWEWYTSTLYTRQEREGSILITLTRWHEDDLAGRILSEYADRTTLLNLPCEAEENDLLGREAGEALCPEIGKGNAWLSDFKTTFTTEQGVRSWNALYQGRPTSAEGNLLKREWWQYYDYRDYAERNLLFDTMILSVDATFKDQEHNDYVAIEAWGKKGANMYLVDVINEHLSFSDTMRAIIGMKAMYPQTGAILIEDKANGSAIIQMLHAEIAGVIAVLPNGGKEARVSAVSPAIEAGNVYLPRDRAFTGAFIDQCASFPNGKHDDMVDAMSQALARLIFTHTGGKIPPKPKGDWDFVRKPKRVGTGKGDVIHVI